MRIQFCNEWRILSTILRISSNFHLHRSWLVSGSGLWSATLCLLHLHHLHGWEHMLRQHSNSTVCQVMLCPWLWGRVRIHMHVSPIFLPWWVCLHPLFARSNIPHGEYFWTPDCIWSSSDFVPPSFIHPGNFFTFGVQHAFSDWSPLSKGIHYKWH